MTQTKQHCSTPDEILTFLRGQLSAREEADLQQHLEDCVACRERLESTAADGSVWKEAREFFASGALQNTLKDSSEDHEEANQGSQRIRQVLDSLGPTDDPESLGRIGGYEVTGVVGAGGMGVVLKAHDRSLDRIVAIKVMSPHMASSGSARKRFAREAKAAAAVLHPNVIAIHSVASEDANPYLVMPFVRGTSLQKRIDSQGPLPLKDTLRIGAQIAAGLAAAHEQGLVHRDIKPANILLEEGVERVTITDFGLARAVDDASMTCSGVIAGTPQYMSPEQARGEPIDARSDLFSLGGVLYAMCTGRSPFRAETTYGVLHRIANDKPTSVCEINTDVPVWLGHVIERLMAKRPEDRFESAAQVAELLEGCLAHVQQPVAISLPDAVAALSPKKTRRPPIGKFIAAAAGACALLFASVLIVLELGKGTLTIESELENVPIRIMQGDKVVDRLTVTKSGNSVRVAAGTYVIELDAKLDGMVVENDQVSLNRGATEQVKIRYAKPVVNARDGSSTFRFETPEALMKHAADCQTKGDGPGFMDCWTDRAFKDFVPSYLITSIMQLQYSENVPHSKPSHPEEIVELKQILAEEFGSTEAGKSLLTLALAHKEIADRSADKFAEAAEATAESPLVQLLASSSTNLIDARSFIMKLSALHEKYGEPDAKKEPRVFAYTVEQDGDKAVATETTGKNKFGLIKTDSGWRINDVFYGLKAKSESVTLQGEWEFISVESDGVITEYKTPRLRLTVAADVWTVQGEGGIETMSSNGHRVGVDGNKLTFHSMTTIAHELGSSEEIPTIGYGLWQVDGDTLTYLMTPAILAVKTFGPQPPIEFAESFETKGTKNTVYRLRRVEASTPTIPSSSANILPAKSSPELPPVKIVVHDEEGKPLEGVKVSLYQLAKDQGGQVLEINETSNANGLAVNRNLPYGHYELSATTADGWYLTGYRSRLNVEFEKGVDAILVAPTPGKTSKLVISSDIMTSPEKISGLRFGGLTEGNRTDHAPEPEGSDSFKEKEFSSFPTITNGIEYVGVQIGLEIWRNISQPAPSMQQMNTRWYWSRPPNSEVSKRYLIANGQARSFDLLDEDGYTARDVSLTLPPVEGSDFFKLPGLNYQVSATLLKPREPTPLPLELDIPAGDVRVKIGSFFGKPSASVMATLKWQPREKQPELWLQAYIAPDSAWVERLINIDWINSPFRSGGSVGFTALWRDQALQPGERLEIPLGMKHDQKTSLKTKASGEEAEPNMAQPALLHSDQVIDALVTFEFSGVVGNATLNTSGIGWVVDQRGHILVPSETAPRSEDYSIEVRYADGSRTSAKRVFTFGHLALLKPDKAPAIAPIKLNSKQAVQDGDQVLAILNGTDVQKGTVTSARKTIVSLDSWPILYSPRLRFPNAIETDFKSDPATLFGAPLLTPSGEVVGMLLNYKPPLFAIPLSEIQIACREFEANHIQSAVNSAEATVAPAEAGDEHSEIVPGTIDSERATNAVKCVMQYLMAVKEKDSETINSVAKGLAKNANRENDIAKLLTDAGIPKHYKTWRMNYSAVVALGPLSTSDKQMNGRFLLFTLSLVDERWSIVDIDLEVEEKLLERFKNPIQAVDNTPETANSKSNANANEKNSSKSSPDYPDSPQAAAVAYLDAALQGDVPTAAGISRGQATTPKFIREFVSILRAVEKPSVQESWTNDGQAPTRALVVTHILPLKEKRPDSNRDGHLLFTLERIEERWFVIDVVFESTSDTQTKIRRFKEANPKAVGSYGKHASANEELGPYEQKVLGIEKPLDRKNARAVVEAYVASALAGHVAKAAVLAKNSPADPKHIQELPEFLNVKRLKIETAYINDPAKPTQALATSEAVRLEEEHKNPDGRRDGFMVFTLELTDEKWFVIDIDFETESGAEKELKKFLKANPNSIGIPPQS